MFTELQLWFGASCREGSGTLLLCSNSKSRSALGVGNCLESSRGSIGGFCVLSGQGLVCVPVFFSRV